MRLDNIDHVLRAAASICEETEFCVVGSQAIFGQHPDITDAVLTRSIELDLYPLNAPEKSELLNTIGVMSRFHDEFGYYADGVGPETVVAPDGWEHRRVAITTYTLQGAKVRGWCLETHDLLISKYVAGREKDIEDCGAVIRLGQVDKHTLLKRLNTTPIVRQRAVLIAAQIEAAYKAAKREPAHPRLLIG